MVLDSVRIRLTLWYTGAMALVLLVLAGTVYFLLKENVIRRADGTAVELAESFLTTVSAEVDDVTKPDSIDEGVAAAMSEHRYREVIFAVLDPQGYLLGVSQSQELPERDEDPTRKGIATVLRPLLNSGQKFRSIRYEGHTYRAYVRPFTIEKQDATLIVLQSLHQQNEFLETLTGTMAVVIPLALLLAGLGGYALARNSLAPVVQMSEQARRIGAENLHERLRVANPSDELGQLAASFNGLLDRLDRSFEEQRRFVADASHELRTPVAILCGETEVTLSQPARSEQEYRESLEILRDEAKRLRRIVEDLFTLARADAGQHPLEFSEFYLDELLAECVRNARTLAAAKDISLTYEAQSELPLSGDPSLLRRMLLNLLDNAIKYTPRGGTVTACARQEGGEYRVSIEDTGQGVPPELQSKIFERFFRVDKARSRGEGTIGGAGLGLSIASWIANAHGGRVVLTRSGSEGSLFTVFLPKKAPQG